MLRDKSLIPLSRQHQHALALCVRIDRAQPIAADLETWQAEIERHFKHEIKFHFSAEEQVLFPAAQRFSVLVPLVDELIADHTALRELFSQAATRRMDSGKVVAFAQRLSLHIRKEERELFEKLQELMTVDELATLGEQLNEELKDAIQSCSLDTARPAAKQVMR
jgi:hemerythrin-like domain-containing protein